MRKNAIKVFYGAIAIALMVIATSQGAVAQSISNGQKVKLQGLIIARAGEVVTMRTSDGGNVVVNLTDNTKVKEKHELIRRKNMAVTALIPGLKIEVHGVGNDKGQVDAESIEFGKGDVETAQTIQAGLNPTQQQLQTTEQQVKTNQAGIQANKQATQANKQAIQAEQQEIEANQQRIQASQQALAKVSNEEADLHRRFNELTDYEVKIVSVVHFASNSSALDEAAKRDLSEVARLASTQRGYVVQVAGYTSSTGGAALNQRLSEDRSHAVVNYLAQTGNIPLRNILAPAAMGSTNPVATNAVAEGRAFNRRVEVKVLVNKGLSN